MSEDVEPGSTSSMVRRIAQCHFSVNEIHGADIATVNVKALYLKIAQQLKPSHNPRVLLCVKNKFRGAAIHICLSRFGFLSTVCFDCEDAVRMHLRHTKCAFDCIIVEWEMQPVSGYDLTQIVRTRYKDKVCVIGLVTAKGLAGDVTRGGGDLFFRTPLMLHTRVLRKLLLPKSMTNPRFPLQLIRRPANYEAMVGMLNVDKNAGDLNDIPTAPEPDPVLNEHLLTTVVDYCKLHDPKNKDVRWKEMMMNIFDAMISAKQALINVTQEASTMRQQTEYCELFHGTPTVTILGNDDEEVDRMTKTELTLQYLLLKKKYKQQTDDIYFEVQSLAKRDEEINTALGSIFEAHITDSLHKEMSTGIGTNTDDSQKSGHHGGRSKKFRRKFHDFVEGLSAKLEMHLMQHEDTLVQRHSRKLQNPIVMRFPWPPMLPSGSKKVYDGVRKMLDGIFRECNKLAAHVQGLAPAAHSRFEEFEEGVLKCVPTDAVPLFTAEEVVKKKEKEKKEPPPKASRIETLTIQGKMEAAKKKVALILCETQCKVQQHRVFALWFGFAVGRRQGKALRLALDAAKKREEDAAKKRAAERANDRAAENITENILVPISVGESVHVTRGVNYAATNSVMSETPYQGAIASPTFDTPRIGDHSFESHLDDDAASLFSVTRTPAMSPKKPVGVKAPSRSKVAEPASPAIIPQAPTPVPHATASANTPTAGQHALNDAKKEPVAPRQVQAGKAKARPTASPLPPVESPAVNAPTTMSIGQVATLRAAPPAGATAMSPNPDRAGLASPGKNSKEVLRAMQLDHAKAPKALGLSDGFVLGGTKAAK